MHQLGCRCPVCKQCRKFGTTWARFYCSSDTLESGGASPAAVLAARGQKALGVPAEAAGAGPEPGSPELPHLASVELSLQASRGGPAPRQDSAPWQDSAGAAARAEPLGAFEEAGMGSGADLEADGTEVNSETGMNEES